MSDSHKTIEMSDQPKSRCANCGLAYPDACSEMVRQAVACELCKAAKRAPCVSCFLAPARVRHGSPPCASVADLDADLLALAPCAARVGK